MEGNKAHLDPGQLPTVVGIAVPVLQDFAEVERGLHRVA